MRWTPGVVGLVSILVLGAWSGRGAANETTREAPAGLKKVEEDAPLTAPARSLGSGGEPAGDEEAVNLPRGEERKSAGGSKQISVPSGSGTISGMGESFSAELSTGIASF